MKSKSPDSNFKVRGKNRSKVNKSGVRIKSAVIFFTEQYHFSNMGEKNSRDAQRESSTAVK